MWTGLLLFFRQITPSSHTSIVNVRVWLSPDTEISSNSLRRFILNSRRLTDCCPKGEGTEVHTTPSYAEPLVPTTSPLLFASLTLDTISAHRSLNNLSAPSKTAL